jgi:F-type H+-transporting ATPase subunit beta
MADYYRDGKGRYTLLFIDNIFRFTQAGSEVSACWSACPRRGISAHPATEMGQLQERINIQQ